MKFTRLIIQSLLAVLALTLAGGCGITMSQVSVQQSPLTGGRVLPHRAVLVLNQELADYKHGFHLVGGTDVYPIGSALQDYARNVTGRSFQQVDVVPSEEKAASLTSDDLILIPRAVKSDTSFGHGKFTITLVVEWTAKNRASQNTVWLKTITANASEKMGSAFTTLKHRRMLFQKAFDDLSPQTYKAFQEAPEFRGNQL
jgi:hypothetical protein